MERFHVVQDLQAQSNVPIPVLVILLEDVGHPLQTDARLHEQVEAHCVLTAPIIGTIEQCDELLRQAVPKCDQSFVELDVGNGSAVVGVKAVE